MFKSSGIGLCWAFRHSPQDVGAARLEAVSGVDQNASTVGGRSETSTKDKTDERLKDEAMRVDINGQSDLDPTRVLAGRIRVVLDNG